MTVVAGWFAGKVWPSPPPLAELTEVLQTDIKLNSALNSKVRTPLPLFSSLAPLISLSYSCRVHSASPSMQSFFL